jgi:hypothetical protein
MSETPVYDYATPFQQLFAVYWRSIAKICISLSFSVLSSNFSSLLIMNASPLQTESKGNLIQMALYRHLKALQPQAIRPKKQTFSNFRTVSLLRYFCFC